MKKVIILGGGIAGLSTAISLRDMGVSVQLFEKATEIKPVGAGIMLASNVHRILAEWGLLELLNERGHKLERFVISSNKGRTLATLNLKQDTKQTVAIHRADLHEILLKQLRDIPIYYGKKAVQYFQDEHGIKVVFNDGEAVTGDLLIAADGIHSVIRKQLLPNKSIRYAGYTCWRGVTNTKEQIKLADELHEIWGANGRFGYVPISNEKVYWYMLMKRQLSDVIISTYTVSNLKEYMEGYPQPVLDLLKNTPNEQIINHDIYDLPPINQYAFGKVALVGDAAHAMTPNLGQGACQGIEDAYVLGQCLHNNIETGLKEYENRRVARASKISKLSYKIGSIAQFDNPFLCTIRNGLMMSTPQFLSQKQNEFIYDYQHN
ncbi:FAD-dependent monooxygenase [Bacillus solimangrovi]|uniref:FAD-binding domain-containing protein n=1 Tax=Bacillus solimangrovi TaxID=1305675 RepID=A0A1E5LKC4_9BACI|nr:FAD-dependent monooxygenase [Bacillus solimangrovi]OEH94542.1 hypothetical protein BFG57_07685 [Bacillus solimangrovi]